MCGLTLSVRWLADASDEPPDEVFDSLCAACQCRGPDSHNVVRRVVKTGTGTVEVKLAASVLGLRGNHVVSQPLVGERGILGWNGQVFQGMDLAADENDTRRILQRLEAGENLRDVLAAIEGPYACVWLDQASETIHFQLDPLSRRSLLVHAPDAKCSAFYLSSVRSGLARERGVDFRVLDGGEGGVLSLQALLAKHDALEMHAALKWRETVDENSAGGSSGPFTHVPFLRSDLLPEELGIQDIGEEVERFLLALQAAVRRRIENIPLELGTSRVAVLFSGGVDCTLLAALIHRCLPPEEPIELLNVAFHKASLGDRPYDVPDRLSSLAAMRELEQVCPGRDWRLVMINITQEEAAAARQAVLDLMYPCETEMDLSLAYPLYFASRGRGEVDDGKERPYETRAKVYISGLGADEQLGGYVRHATAFRRSSWPGLLSELCLDVARLPTRNLSRDDRILSSFARDARYPYLDLEFMRYLADLPVWIKTDPRVPSGGNKRLLRMAAAKLGLKETAKREKRAMQFGSGSSKIGGARRGHDKIA